MSKKFFPFLVCIICFLVIGCGEKKEDVKPEDTQNVSDETTVKEEEKKTTAVQTKIEKQTLYNANNITITAESFDASSVMGPAVTISVKNNSENNIAIQARNTSVNGFMMDPIFSLRLEKGSQKEEKLSFLESSLAKYDISEIGEIEMTFVIFEGENQENKFASEPIKITTSAKNYKKEIDTKGNVLYDKGGIKIISKGLENNKDFGIFANLYIENNSNALIEIQAKDVAVNGKPLTPVFSCLITPGKKALDGLLFYNELLRENKIENIESLELNFSIFENANFNKVKDTERIKYL